MSIPHRVLPASEPRRTESTWLALTRFDGSIRGCLEPFGIEFQWSPTIVTGMFGLVVVWAGFAVAGLPGSATGVVAMAGLGFALRIGATRRRALALQHGLPEVCLRVARVIRSGRPIDSAVAEVRSEMDGIPGGLAAVAEQVATGLPVSQALRAWAAGADSSAERVLSAAMVLGVEQGGDLAAALDSVGEGIRDDLDLADRRRVLLVQATMSAVVLVLMPVAFAVVASIVRGGFVFQGPLGIALVCGGLGLDALGCLWMRALMRGLR